MVPDPGHQPLSRAAPLWLATHEAARTIVPDAMVGYVDYDPVPVAHSQALLATGSRTARPGGRIPRQRH
ncbi:MAG: SAM-dependent methyltransferase, partial [Streptosporangiaceae bacterium]